MSALPFCAFRWSSTTSVDVQEKLNGPWLGLAGVEGVTCEELIRHAKSAFTQDGEYKVRFLMELPRLLMWSGVEDAKVMTTSGDGEIFFAIGAKVKCEVEDSQTGEIDEKQFLCTAENYAAARKTAEAAMEEIAMKRAQASIPKVGLDAATSGMGGPQASAGGRTATTDYDEDEHNEQNHSGEEEDEDDNEGLGVDAEPPADLVSAVLSSHLQSIVASAAMLGLGPRDVKRCFQAAGGVLTEKEEEAGSHEHAMPPGMRGPPGAGQPECQQQ